jgi:hypothetical protein
MTQKQIYIGEVSLDRNKHGYGLEIILSFTRINSDHILYEQS